MKPFSYCLALTLTLAACADAEPSAPLDGSKAVMVVTDSIRCASCLIHIDTLVTITGSDSAPVFSSTRLALSPGGTYIAAAPLADQGVVALFDASGGFLQRLLRDGDGPGEMRRIRFAVWQADSLLLLIGSDGRARQVMLPTGSIESSALPEGMMPYGLVSAANGLLIANAVSPLFPNVAVLSDSLKLLRAFGDSLRDNAADETTVHPLSLELRLGASDGEVIVQARRMLSPDLTVWTLEGKRLRQLTRTAAWYPPYTPAEYQETSALLPSEVRVRPEIVAVWPDTGSLIWLAGRVPDRRWQPGGDTNLDGSKLGNSAIGRPVLPDYDWSDFLDTVIEVIDWRRGEVIAHAIIDTYAYRMAAAGVLEVPGIAESGEEKRTLIRPRLVMKAH
jgi:hypothetical protein